jgi:cytochrome c biogenesis protein CcdA
MVAPKTLELALLTAAVLGFRHGFDYDHVAAISDITNVELDSRRAMRMGLLYVLGHAATVAALGSLVIIFQTSLPPAIDNWAERLVGLTLVILGIYVLGSMFRGGAKAAPKSRILILMSAFRWTSWRIRQLFHDNQLERPAAADWNYTKKSVFLIGVIHGLGAETPSQLLIFLLAANLGGLGRGFLGLGMFLAGLLLMNTLMTASAVGIFSASATRHRLMQVATALTATYSLVVGAIFLFGSAAILPPLGG